MMARGSGREAAQRPPWSTATAPCVDVCAASSGLEADSFTRTETGWGSLLRRRVVLPTCSIGGAAGQLLPIRCTAAAVRAHRDHLTTVSWIVLLATRIAMGKHPLGRLPVSSPIGVGEIGAGLARRGRDGQLWAAALPMAPVATPACTSLTERWSSRQGA